MASTIQTGPAQRTAHVVIEGLVQGVGFRMWVEREAAAHGVTGWVRNRRTGAVETVIAGDTGAVDAMLAACRKGPPAARVDALYIVKDVTDGSLGVFPAFSVRDTA